MASAAGRGGNAKTQLHGLCAWCVCVCVRLCVCGALVAAERARIITKYRELIKHIVGVPRVRARRLDNRCINYPRAQNN